MTCRIDEKSCAPDSILITFLLFSGSDRKINPGVAEKAGASCLKAMSIEDAVQSRVAASRSPTRTKLESSSTARQREAKPAAVLAATVLHQSQRSVENRRAALPHRPFQRGRCGRGGERRRGPRREARIGGGRDAQRTTPRIPTERAARRGQATAPGYSGQGLHGQRQAPSPTATAVEPGPGSALLLATARPA